MIFHSRCTIRHKVCNRIIDGESYTNTTSTLLVDKLGIPTIPYPKPYALKSLNESGDTKALNQALFLIFNWREVS